MQYRRATVADAPVLAAMNAQLIRDKGPRATTSLGYAAVRLEIIYPINNLPLTVKQTGE